MAQPRIGETVLGRYRLACQLCYGSIGTVFLATDDKTGEPVIVKWILHSRITSKDALDRLQLEVDNMLGAEHPNIAPPLALGGEGDAHFLVTEYSHGYDLGPWFDLVKELRGEFPVDVAVHIAIEALRGLQYAHEKTGPNGKPLGIVHKDITPANILIDIDGHVKITDFGIGKVVSGGTAVTDGSMIRKFAYLPPELVKNETPSPGTDVYSVGLILLELVTGENPFAAPSLPATLTGIMTKDPPRADATRSGLPPGLSDAIAKAVSKEPGARYASAKEFADALEATRTSSAEDTAAELKRLVSSDFKQPRISEIADVPSLDQRMASKEAARPRMSEPPARRKKPTNPWPIIAGVLALLIAAGAAFILLSD